MNWLYLSAGFMVVTAAIHSYGGEKRLISPLLTINQGILAVPFSRRILRSAWHLTSIFMLLTAAVMVWPQTALSLKAMTAGFWLVLGLFSLLSSRGKHIGWPTLTLAGVSGLLGSVG